METISVILSLAGLAFAILSLVIKSKDVKLLLVLALATNLLVAVSYLLVFNMNGCLASSVGAIVGLVNVLYAQKQRPLPKWLPPIYAVAFLAVNLLVFRSWIDILAILAPLAAIGGMCSANGKQFRLWYLGNNCIWTIYDAICGSYGPLITHTILTIVGIIGIYINDIHKPKIENERA